MDRSTKVTLWVAFTVLVSYFVWFYLDCAMDDTCHIVCVNGGRRGCHTERVLDPKIDLRLSARLAGRFIPR
jgi:hypothetical protein